MGLPGLQVRPNLPRQFADWGLTLPDSQACCLAVEQDSQLTHSGDEVFSPLRQSF